jgi:hypothetical protein
VLNRSGNEMIGFSWNGMGGRVTAAPLWRSVFSVLMFVCGLSVAQAAAPAASTMKILSAAPANVDPRIVQPYVLHTEPTDVICRSRILVIPSYEASLISAATQFVQTKALADIVYAADDQGFCVVTSIRPSVSSRPSPNSARLVSTESEGSIAPWLFGHLSR